MLRFGDPLVVRLSKGEKSCPGPICATAITQIFTLIGGRYLSRGKKYIFLFIGDSLGATVPCYTFWINSRILSVSLASHVSTHLLIHLSAHLYHHHHSHHPSLLHSFTPGSKPTFSTNPSQLRLLLPTGLPSWQRDWTGPIMLTVLFLVSHFNFCLFRMVD